MAAAAELPKNARRLGDYELLIPIGRGAFGAVHLARKHGAGGFERIVAIKLAHPHLRDDPTVAAEMAAEARLAARLSHPNVVPVIDVGETDEDFFLVMDYVDGESLASLLGAMREQGAPVPIEMAVRIVADVLAGLHAAHELRETNGRSLGLVHRDVSPQNVLVGADGTARITDFGIAKTAEGAGLTKTGTIKGKIGYMAPEQVRDEPLDRRVDVWAAGVILWETLAGQRLHPSGDVAATLLKIVTEPIPDVRTVRPDVPPALAEALASALEKDPDSRCPTALELRRRIVEAVPRVDDSEQLTSLVEEWGAPSLAKRRSAMVTAQELATAHAAALSTKGRRGLWAIAPIALALVAIIGIATSALAMRARASAAATTAQAEPSAPAASPDGTLAGTASVTPAATPSVTGPSAAETAAPRRAFGVGNADAGPGPGRAGVRTRSGVAARPAPPPPTPTTAGPPASARGPALQRSPYE